MNFEQFIGLSLDQGRLIGLNTQFQVYSVLNTLLVLATKTSKQLTYLLLTSSFLAISQGMNLPSQQRKGTSHNHYSEY